MKINIHSIGLTADEGINGRPLTRIFESGKNPVMEMGLTVTVK